MEGFLPYRSQIRHSVGVVLEVRLLAHRNCSRILMIGKDVFLAPGGIYGRVLVLSWLLPLALRGGLGSLAFVDIRVLAFCRHDGNEKGADGV